MELEGWRALQLLDHHKLIPRCSQMTVLDMSTHTVHTSTRITKTCISSGFDSRVRVFCVCVCVCAHLDSIPNRVGPYGPSGLLSIQTTFPGSVSQSSESLTPAGRQILPDLMSQEFQRSCHLWQNGKTRMWHQFQPGKNKCLNSWDVWEPHQCFSIDARNVSRVGESHN